MTTPDQIEPISKPVTMSLALSSIKADPSAQPREMILADTVKDYTERMVAGDAFPPMVVFYDGEAYWPGDGFHRYQAALDAGLNEFQCEVRNGTLRDAILYSCGANATHGIPRTNEDKRRAVMKLLADNECRRWSSREIAKQARVDPKTVERLREENTDALFIDPPKDRASAEHLQGKGHLRKSSDRPRTVKRGGTVYTQKTGNIGKAKPDAAASDADPLREAAHRHSTVEPGDKTQNDSNTEESNRSNLQDENDKTIDQLGKTELPRGSGEAARLFDSFLQFCQFCRSNHPAKVAANMADNECSAVPKQRAMIRNWLDVLGHATSSGRSRHRHRDKV